MKQEEIFKEKTGLSFNNFYLENKLKIYNYLKSINNNYDLEDIVDESFILLLKYIKNFDSKKSKVTTYLMTIARNELFKNLKSKSKLNTIDISDDSIMDYFNNTNFDSNDKYDYDTDEKFKLIESEINDYDNEIVKLWFYGDTLKKIVEKTKIDLSNVKTIIYSFKNKIRKKYDIKIDGRNPNRGRINFYKEKKLCVDCGEPVKYNKAIRCDACNRKHRRLYKRPPLLTLQMEVYLNGYSWTGRKYGVDARTIKNWIKNYE